MQKILGLDIGTNSIGWSLIEHDLENHEGKIVGLGSRIIPMDGREKDFEAGTSVSKTADRRQARSARRLLQRYKLRRIRLIKVFKELDWFPKDFPEDFKELEKFNINNFVPFEQSTIDEAKKIFNTEKISTDWVIYFLRTKALKEKISLQELARVIYHFNQRRGFKSSRKDKKEEIINNEETKYPLREKIIEILKIGLIKESEEKSKYGKVFQLTAFNPEDIEYNGTLVRKAKPDWEGKELEIEITKVTNKAGETRYEFRLPDRTDWEKMKIALEKDIKESGLYAGEYHFTHLIQDRNYRIKDRIIDRSHYKVEFDAIWKKQAEFHPELTDKTRINSLVDILYKHNIEKRIELLANDLHHLIRNDIIYYQREPKSQKHLVAECNYEKKSDIKGNTYGVKVAPKSSPAFQEFRIWQDIHSLKIFRLELKLPDGNIKLDIDETNIYLDMNGKEKLFNLFERKTNISQKDILKELSNDVAKLTETSHRINYPEDKEFKGNETKAKFRIVFKRHNYVIEGEKLLGDAKKFELLWHIVYSLKEEKHIETAVKKHFGFDEELAKHISKLPEFPSQYSSYSTKALNKLLPLMRCGSKWNEENISIETEERINKIITGEFDASIPPRVRENFFKKRFNQMSDFQGLQTYLACYLVYGRHSERENENKYDSFNEIKTPEQNSLRNPIVEQITNETLQIVKDVWKEYGRPDEIHIELARDLKKNADERKKLTERATKNEIERKKVVSILKELKNANADSPSDIERLRLWEETGNRSAKESYPKFSKEPTRQEIEKYILWGEQNHISPYTGNVIPLSKLFTAEYEIEHIIPRSRFFDDSFGNKTICESSINKFKDNYTARQLIEEYGGTVIKDTGIKLLNREEYILHIKNTFFGKKRKHFLSEEIPEGFIERQINDTRYIGKKLGELLYPIPNEGVVFTIGSITSELKDKWGLHRVWKELLKPRFERLEEITGEKLIDLDKEHNDIRFKKDYKRIDHRHHALDALIIAATRREHIRYINSLNAADTDKELKDIRLKLVKKKVREFVLPWNTFTKDAKETLKTIVVSHKNRTRVVTKGFNLYSKWVLENGRWIKKAIPQENGSLLSVRKSMFKEPLSIIHLAEYKEVSVKKAIEIQFNYLTKYNSKLQPRIANKELRNSVNILIKNCLFDLAETQKYVKANSIKDDNGVTISKIQILEFNEYAAKRVALDKTFDSKKIDKIPYSKQQNNRLVRLLREHLKENNDSPQEAFSGEGLYRLAQKYGKPITKITTYEKVGEKLNVNGKLVEADKGSILFFVMYENMETGIREEMYSVPLLDAVSRIANKLPIAEDRSGYRTIILSPNDLVYVPDPDENVKLIDWENKKKISERIYKVVSFSGGECQFLPHYVASLLLPYDNSTKKGEFGSLNKSEKSLDGITIKKVCIKAKVDRLGNIKPVM